MRKKILLIPLALLLAISLVAIGCPAPPEEVTPTPPEEEEPTPTPVPPGPELPKVITITSQSTGSAMNMRACGCREAIEKFSPMKARIEGRATDLDQVAPLYYGEAELGLITGATVYSAAVGQFTDIGPVQIRRVWHGYPFIGALFVRGDAGIKTWADLRGKRIPQTAASVGWSKNIEACLAFGGLTLDDVQVVEVSSLGAGINGVGEGTVDAAYACTFSAGPVELAASRHGIKWLELLPEDTEGWDRLRAVRPPAVPVRTSAPGIKEGETIWAYGYEEALWSTAEVSDDIIYAVCKAMKEGYNVYKGAEPNLEFWTWELAYEPEGLLDLPYHSGTIKFFKDMGVWTPAHEAFQEKALKSESTRLGK